MARVKVSPEYQIVIPEDVRQSMGIEPGAELKVLQNGDRIELVPVMDVRKMRGFLKGIDTRIERDEEDRI